MSGEGSDFAPPRDAAAVIASIGPRLRDGEGALIPGASLLLVTYCRAHGIPLRGGDLDLLASFLDLPATEVSRVLAFHDCLLETSGNGEQSTFCLGVNCSLHGAAALHKQLRSGFEREGTPLIAQEVHCLGHCEQGPSIQAGRQTYCGREQRVVTDEREWRPTDDGQVPVTDDSVPVRD